MSLSALVLAERKVDPERLGVDLDQLLHHVPDPVDRGLDLGLLPVPIHTLIRPPSPLVHVRDVPVESVKDLLNVQGFYVAEEGAHGLDGLHDPGGPEALADGVDGEGGEVVDGLDGPCGLGDEVLEEDGEGVEGEGGHLVFEAELLLADLAVETVVFFLKEKQGLT